MAWRYYYDILGVAPTASADQLTRAYRRLAGKYSPELNATADAASRWGRISEAYAVLSDPAKRRLYDQYGPAAVSGKGGAAAREAGRSRRASTVAGRPAPGTPATTALDRWERLSIGVDDAVTGATRMVTVPHLERCSGCAGNGMAGPTSAECPLCGGRGFRGATGCTGCGGLGVLRSVGLYLADCRGVVLDVTCPLCHGRGYRHVYRRFHVAIPPGIRSGQHIRLAGAGDSWGADGARGDLYVTIEVTPTASRRT